MPRENNNDLFYEKPLSLFRAEVQEQFEIMKPYLKQILLEDGIDISKFERRIGISVNMASQSNSFGKRAKGRKKHGATLVARHAAERRNAKGRHARVFANA